jgi:hypothetical protein
MAVCRRYFPPVNILALVNESSKVTVHWFWLLSIFPVGIEFSHHVCDYDKISISFVDDKFVVMDLCLIYTQNRIELFQLEFL